jgi:hypothetical protein
MDIVTCLELPYSFMGYGYCHMSSTTRLLCAKVFIGFPMKHMHNL